jgi:hypothetical protein
VCGYTTKLKDKKTWLKGYNINPRPTKIIYIYIYMYVVDLFWKQNFKPIYPYPYVILSIPTDRYPPSA